MLCSSSHVIYSKLDLSKIDMYGLGVIWNIYSHSDDICDLILLFHPSEHFIA